MTVAVLPEIQAGRRVFAVAQTILSTGFSAQRAQQITLGWHDSIVNSENGSFAVVNSDAAMAGLVGEIVQVAIAGGASVYAYVLTTADVPVQLSLTRRLFLSMARLTIESLPATVSVMQ